MAVFVGVYLLGRIVVSPLFGRALDARGLDTHAKRPLKKLANVVVLFVAIAVAFEFAGFGNFLLALTTVAAAATLAIGFALQDVIKNFVFGIGYDDDIDRATEIILEEAERHEDILDDPKPSVRLLELGDSSVGLQSRIWIADPSRADFVKTRGEYVQAVKERFDEEGVDIPYPNRTIGGGLELANVEGIAEPVD